MKAQRSIFLYFSRKYISFFQEKSSEIVLPLSQRIRKIIAWGFCQLVCAYPRVCVFWSYKLWDQNALCAKSARTVMNHTTPATKAQAVHKLNLPSTCSKLLILPSQTEKSKVAYRMTAWKNAKLFLVFSQQPYMQGIAKLKRPELPPLLYYYT